MTSIKNRTSIRKYSTKEVSDELLNQLLEEAMRTPTMGNLQLYSVVVTRSEEGKKALAPAHFNQPMVTRCPCCTHHLCRLSPHHPMGREPQGNSWLRQHSLLHECRYRCTPLHPDIHQSGRRGRTWYLLFGHNGLYAKDDYRHLETSEARNACSHINHRMAR